MNKLLVLVACVASFVAGYVLGTKPTAGFCSERGVDTVVYVDTVRYYIMVPKDSVVLRYRTVMLPVAAADSAMECGADSCDSVAVAVPIVQKHYSGTDYDAWVSGGWAQLDSLNVYPRKEVVTLREKVKYKRWHLGLSVGYGYTPAGFQPYAGVCISYSLISF